MNTEMAESINMPPLSRVEKRRNIGLLCLLGGAVACLGWCAMLRKPHAHIVRFAIKDKSADDNYRSVSVKPDSNLHFSGGVYSADSYTYCLTPALRLNNTSTNYCLIKGISRCSPVINETFLTY
jgi:hypothetical protein